MFEILCNGFMYEVKFVELRQVDKSLKDSEKKLGVVSTKCLHGGPLGTQLEFSLDNISFSKPWERANSSVWPRKIPQEPSR